MFKELINITDKDNKFGHQRIIIENVNPEIDCGNIPIKRCINDVIVVQAKIFAEGHDELGASLNFRSAKATDWQSTEFRALGNDLWEASFTVTELSYYYYTIVSWINYFSSWRRNLVRWQEAHQDISLELRVGAELIKSASSRANSADSQALLYFYHRLGEVSDTKQAFDCALSDELLQLMNKYPDTENLTEYPKQLPIVVERIKSRFSSWYELFPRSLGKNQQHGTIQDLIRHLPYISNMGFDVLYLPPIHPIGKTYRKGKNNAPVAQPDEPGSPWGIGSEEGGHTDINPLLGTMEDFKQLISKANEVNLEIALDLALQCTPDHPVVKENSQWFKKRPDGSIQYAENPPKKYQDIYPIYFQTEDWKNLWINWKNTVFFWIKQGVKIFRVDNPHTKPFIFWQWLISEVRYLYPDVIFLSEAFTRPSIMYYLAKIGFSQSYTYFTWRNNKAEIIQYLTELTKTQVHEYFRPNFWPNTPDILHEFLQAGNRPGFIIRVVLAATLASNYGIYGPAYELCFSANREPGSEEYLDSEKYQLKEWDLNQPLSIYEIIKKINVIRKNNPALQDNLSLIFHPIENEELIAYSKSTPDKKNVILVVVNLNPHHTHSGMTNLSVSELGIDENENYSVHDLLSDEKYIWHGKKNYVELNPNKSPAHIFQIIPIVKNENNFPEYQ